MNGFGSQGLPRGEDVENPVDYPFKSFDGSTTLDRQTSGQRVFDINVDGVAHYGLYPDWIEDLRMLAGDRIIKRHGPRRRGVPPDVGAGGRDTGSALRQVASAFHHREGHRPSARARDERAQGAEAGGPAG